MQIILASNNQHKIKEINDMLDGRLRVISLQEAGITEEIPEPYDTFEENAYAKARYAFERTGITTFAEDSGLVVPALGGAPGVHSARYAGEPRSDERNTALLLENMKDMDDRKAYYKTLIAFVDKEGVSYFEGRCDGRINTEKQGDGGFGYDPVFIPEGYEQTFGALPPGVKNEISHRAKAMALFIAYLKDKQY